MQIIHCTQKLIKEIKADIDNEVMIESAFGSWHANLLRIERRKCVLFTNDRTLLSIFVPGLKKQDFNDLQKVFRHNLFIYLLEENSPSSFIGKLSREYAIIRFTKSNSRSVLGSMNDIAYHIKMRIEMKGGLSSINLLDINKGLNRIPMGAIGYKFAIEEFLSQEI